MSPEIRHFIEENTDLIEASDWNRLYKKIGERYSVTLAGELSQTLLDAGINPLENSKNIPPYFLAGCSMTSY